MAGKFVAFKSAGMTPIFDRRKLVPAFSDRESAVEAAPKWMPQGSVVVVELEGDRWELFKKAFPYSEEKSAKAYLRGLKSAKVHGRGQAEARKPEAPRRPRTQPDLFP